MTYAGTSDGRVFTVASDGTLAPAILEGASVISRFWVDPVNPQAALAVSGSQLYRTTNGGKFWDNITGNLNGGAIHGITADSTAGVVYAATDNGVYSEPLDINLNRGQSLQSFDEVMACPPGRTQPVTTGGIVDPNGDLVRAAKGIGIELGG